MSTGRLKIILPAVTLCAIALQVAEAGKPVSGGPTATSYSGESLGILPGYNQSMATGISQNGNVVGSCAGGGVSERAFYWNAKTRVMSSITSDGARGSAYAIAGGATEYAVGQEDAAGRRYAVIWIAPPSPPIYLDRSGSTAIGVNDNGTAVGGAYREASAVWGAAIWTLSGGTYVRTDIPLRAGDVESYATDIDNDGVVVGYGYAKGTYAMRAFIRFANGHVLDLPPRTGDPESSAQAVSNVVVSGADPVVYVTGSSGVLQTGPDRSNAVRWTVNVRTESISQMLPLTQTWAEGVNDSGDVAGTTNSRSTQSASLWRNGSYIPLKAPKGGTSTTARGMARRVDPTSSAIYVAGESMVNNWPMAVRWVVK